MLAVENLCKTYSSKRSECRALKGVSFVLPQKGLVFIVGKSGSGKSTLLNLMGGLDTITSGDIIIDGKKLTEFGVKELDDFRNEKLGFIFQDFCLIEGLTVRQNVELALDLLSKEDDGRVSETLASVGLEGLENRYPKELSAGQKQRVAIARALVKSPKIILADEPTGNIDSNSARAVLGILKRMSAEKLVVVISHNGDDALTYADRIIEIGDGEIISDVTREAGYSNEFTCNAGKIVLPYGKPLSPEELKLLNDKVSESRGNIVFDQRGSGFAATVQPVGGGSLGDCQSKGLKPKKVFRYAAAFAKKRWFGALLTTIIISFLMIVFGMSQLFTTFDGSTQIEDTIARFGDKGMFLRQGYFSEFGTEVKSDKILEIEQATIDAVDSLYDGKIYKMYKQNIDVDNNSYFLDSFRPYGDIKIFKNGFASESNGVLVCDLELLKGFFGGDDGTVEVLEGEIKTDGHGVIITDYIADSLLFYDPEQKFRGDYANIINGGYIGGRIKVDAIIATNYMTRYMRLLQPLMEGKKADFKDPEILELYDEVVNRLAVCYSLNPDYKNDYLDAYCAGEAYGRFAHTSHLTFKADENNLHETSATFGYFASFLADDEMLMGFSEYNALFGTDFTADDIADISASEFAGKSVEMTADYGVGDEPFFRREFTIVGLCPMGNFTISDTHLRRLKERSLIPYQIYLDDTRGALSILDAAEDKGLYLSGNGKIALVGKITGYVNIFKDVFLYIAVAVCVIIVFLLALNSFNSIKRSSYEIGVLRAMGGRTGQLTWIFALQTLLMGLIICLITALGSYFGVILFNDVLTESLSLVIREPGIGAITVLSFNPEILAIDFGVIVLLTSLSVIAPILAIRKIRPIKIIRARE